MNPPSLENREFEMNKPATEAQVVKNEAKTIQSARARAKHVFIHASEAVLSSSDTVRGLETKAKGRKMQVQVNNCCGAHMRNQKLCTSISTVYLWVFILEAETN